MDQSMNIQNTAAPLGNGFMKKVFLAAVSLFFVFAAILAGIYAYHMIARPSGLATISVSGTGKMTYKPDIADIDIAIISKGPDASSVQNDNNTKMTAVVEYLKSQGVTEDDIKTISYSLYPEYKQSRDGVDTSQIIGYTMNQGLQFRVRDISLVGKIVGGLSSVGINSLNGISFGLSDEKLETLKTQAKDQAITKAQQELQRMKTQFGFSHVRLVGISDSPIVPMLYRMENAEFGLGGNVPVPAPIQTGTGEVIENVSLAYEIR